MDKINKLKFEKILTALFLLLFSLCLGIFLESIRFHAICYYRLEKMDMPFLTKLTLSIHSEPENLFPLFPAFTIMMLIPCFFIICINYKKFNSSANGLTLFVHSFLCLMFNLSFAILLIVIIADPIYKPGILPEGAYNFSVISFLLLLVLLVLILTCIVLLTKTFLGQEKSEEGKEQSLKNK